MILIYFATNVVSKGIIDLHGGVIGMSSDGHGCGSVFFVELPLVSPRGGESYNIHIRKPLSESFAIQNAMPAVKTSKEGRLIPAEEGTLEDGLTLARYTTANSKINQNFEVLKRRRALIVDDAALNRKMISRLLVTRNFEIEEASDGLEAISSLRTCAHECQRPYDVILMDFVMPNMDGPTATREIRALGYPGIIIGVTGNALAEDIELFMRCGANKVLPKPLRIEEMMKTLTGNDYNNNILVYTAILQFLL